MTREEILEQLDKNPEDIVHEIGIYLLAKMEADGELNGPEIPVFVLWMWNIEMLNGGLCQFFVNDGAYASLVPGSLEAVGAEEYASLLFDFVDKHGINLEDLSEFELNPQLDEEDFSPYIAVHKKYPFEDFDDAFYDLYGSDPLEGRIADYIRDHIDAFITE